VQNIVLVGVGAHQNAVRRLKPGQILSKFKEMMTFEREGKSAKLRFGGSNLTGIRAWKYHKNHFGGSRSLRRGLERCLLPRGKVWKRSK
jgi:hypothetical protein